MSKRNFYRENIDRQTAIQEHMCAYCTLPFGTVVQYRGETVQTATGDHFVPWSYSERTEEQNLVVCCQVCNGIKADRIYDSLEHARRDILITRMNKGIITLFIPVEALTSDSEAWGREYTRYCAFG